MENPFKIGSTVFYNSIKAKIIEDVQMDGFVEIELEGDFKGEKIIEVWVDNLEFSKDADTSDFIKQLQPRI